MSDETVTMLVRSVPKELHRKLRIAKAVLDANTWAEYLAKTLPSNNQIQADGPPSDQLMPLEIQTVLEAKPKTKAQKFIGLVSELVYVNEIKQPKLEAMIRRICQVQDHRAVSNWVKRLEAQGKIWRKGLTPQGVLFHTYASKF